MCFQLRELQGRKFRSALPAFVRTWELPSTAASSSSRWRGWTHELHNLTPPPLHTHTHPNPHLQPLLLQYDVKTEGDKSDRRGLGEEGGGGQIPTASFQLAHIVAGEPAALPVEGALPPAPLLLAAHADDVTLGEGELVLVGLLEGEARLHQRAPAALGHVLRSAEARFLMSTLLLLLLLLITHSPGCGTGAAATWRSERCARSGSRTT